MDQSSTLFAPDREPGRLARLDGLRGLAAVGIAFGFHAKSLYAAGALDTRFAVLDWIQVYGWLFVDLFFLLSGYIFAHAYIGRSTLTRPGGLADFAVARIARLYPLHLAMLVIVAALVTSNPANTPFAFVAHLFMAQALAPPLGNTFVGASWSLSVEAGCYVLFALAAASGPRILRLVTGGALAVAVLSLALHAAPDGPYGRDVIGRGLLGFFLGQVLWHGRTQFGRVPTALLLGLAAVGLAIPPATIGAILPVAVLTFPAVLLVALRTPWMEATPFTWLGDRSYAIYLIHAPLLDLYVHLFGKLGGSPAEVALGHGLAACVILGVSDLVYRHFELPARRAIRAAWQQRQRRLAPA